MQRQVGLGGVVLPRPDRPAGIDPLAQRVGERLLAHPRVAVQLTEFLRAQEQGASAQLPAEIGPGVLTIEPVDPSRPTQPFAGPGDPTGPRNAPGRVTPSGSPGWSLGQPAVQRCREFQTVVLRLAEDLG